VVKIVKFRGKSQAWHFALNLDSSLTRAVPICHEPFFIVVQLSRVASAGFGASGVNYPRASPKTRALLTIGSTAFSENSTVGGGVDDVRNYNRALSAAEIKKSTAPAGNATANRYVAPRSEDILK